MSMKLLIVSALEPWSMGKGVGAPSLYETLKAYATSPHWDVTFVTTEKSANFGGSHEVNIDVGLPNLRVLRYPAENFSWARGRLKSKLERLWGLKLALKNHLKDLLSRESFDVLYCYEEAAINLIYSLPKSYKDDLLLVNRYQGTILGAQYNRFFHCLRKYESWSALRAPGDLFIMTDDGTFGYQALKYWNKNSNDQNILFLRNGIDLSISYHDVSRDQTLINYGLDPNQFYAITISRLAGWKRVDRAITLVKNMKDKGMLMHLLICGDGEVRHKLEDLVKYYGIQKNVSFLGSRDRKEIKDLLKSADLFLSLYDVSNCGNPLFEAQLAGKVTITLNNGGTPSVIQNKKNGLLLQPDDSEALVNATESVMVDHSLRHKLAQNASIWGQDNMKSWQERMNIEMSALLEFVDRA